jgi:hypothetical protein
MLVISKVIVLRLQRDKMRYQEIIENNPMEFKREPEYIRQREVLRKKFIAQGYSNLDYIEFLIDDALGEIPAEDWDGNL